MSETQTQTDAPVNETAADKQKPDPKQERKDLHAEILETLTGRSDYDDNLRTLYDVRRDGVKRLDAEAWQSDTPLKIADPAIEKIKPQLIAGVYQKEAICTFQTEDRGLLPHCKKLSNWLTYKLKCKTNFFRNCVITFDTSLEAAKGIWKTIWDDEKKRVAFDSVHPGKLVVPLETDILDDADWILEIHSDISVAAYKRNKKYNQDPKFISKITGKGTGDASGRSDEYDRNKFEREGITYSRKGITIWELYRKIADQWVVRLYSPVVLDEDIIAEYPVPNYGGKMHPYTGFDAELCTKGWYEPRGVVEKALPEEIIATKHRNLGMDWMQFAAVPIFTSDGTGVNLANYQFRPGDHIPGNVTPVQFAQPPESITEQMLMARENGQEMVGSPNFALSNTNSAGNDKQTATAVDKISQNNALTTDLRTRIYNDSFSDVFLKAYLLYVEMDPKSLTYLWEDELDEIPGDALKDAYMIHPSGNPDGLGRNYEIAISQQMWEVGNSNPRWNQDELNKLQMELRGPEYVKRLFVPGRDAQQNEQEDQVELVLMMVDALTEFEVHAKPGQDHATRVQTSMGLLQKWFMERKPISQRAEQLVANNIIENLELLKKENPTLAKQLEGQLKIVQNQAKIQLELEARQLPPALVPPRMQQPPPGGGLIVPPISNGAPAPQPAMAA